jgi:hypothetical protein
MMSAEGGGSRLRHSQTGESGGALVLQQSNQAIIRGNQTLSYNPELIRWLSKRKAKKTSVASSLNTSGNKKENRHGPMKAVCCQEPQPFQSLQYTKSGIKKEYMMSKSDILRDETLQRVFERFDTGRCGAIKFDDFCLIFENFNLQLTRQECA